MIVVTKLNDEPFMINDDQIQMISMIPETKIVMMNKEFFVVQETPEEITQKIVRFRAQVYANSGILVVKQD